MQALLPEEAEVGTEAAINVARHGALTFPRLVPHSILKERGATVH